MHIIEIRIDHKSNKKYHKHLRNIDHTSADRQKYIQEIYNKSPSAQNSKIQAAAPEEYENIFTKET